MKSHRNKEKEITEGGSTVSTQYPSSKTQIQPSSRKRSQRDEKVSKESNYTNKDYKKKNYWDEDDYNSGELGRGMDINKDNQEQLRKKYKG